jgi:C-terminal processing protease CtpA/Prc
MRFGLSEDEQGRTKFAAFAMLVFFAVYTLSAPFSHYLDRSKGERQLPSDLRGKVSVEKVRQLEAIVGEEIVSVDDYNKKRELVFALSEVTPVLWKFRKNYYRDIPQQEFEEKILGFVAQLDPHSSYESPSEVLDALTQLKQHGGGHAPDLLDDKKAVQKIEPSVVANRYGMIRVIDFNDLDGKGFQMQLTDACNVIWNTVPGGKVEGMILDLRGNRGGYHTNAVVLVSAFMKKSGELILTEKNYNTAKRTKVDKVYTEPDPLGVDNTRLRGLPLLILVDARSASCSEIVAGVLQYFKVGVVASKDPHTFGKGVVQTIYPLQNGRLGQLSVTTHEYFIGRDYRVHGYGIFPDIPLSGAEGDEHDFEEDYKNPIPPSGPAPRFVPMKERNPLLDKKAREMLKTLKLEIR